ncbi:MAG: fused MFS/spermidine synthase [bacterium]|nr:fused MFS/spermidine synthase [bacterium]
MSEPRSYRYLVYSLFLLSGVSGLIYQIVWTRMLVLVFGNTMLATSTVLSAFMGGLAAGSFVLGKYIDREPRPLLRVYAALEAGIGIFALLFPLVLGAATPLYTWLNSSVGSNMVGLNLARYLVCFLIIGVPTFLMGGTLPVLIKRFTRIEEKIGGETGFLYGLNTVGAVLGTFACGYFLLRVLGMERTTWIAVAINLGVAAVAYALGRNRTEIESGARHDDEPAGEFVPAGNPVSPFAIKMVLLGIGISGFCALAYEVFWTRMLNLFLHNNIYSFTAILATFLIGIAVGSLVYARFLSRSRKPLQLFAWLQLGIGAMAYATPFVFSAFHDALFNNFDEALTLVKTAAIMLAPTVMMGIAVPLAIQICRKGVSKEGTSVGNVYAVNTVGAILGAFAAGFILLPSVGLLYGVLIVASLNLFAGLLPMLAYTSGSPRVMRAGAVTLVVAILAFSTPRDLFRGLFQAAHPNAEIVHYKEGKVANVLVYDFNKLGYKDFHLNAVNEASSRLWHVQLFKLLGLLPTVVHDGESDALMIAFGAGMSAGATCSNVSSLDVVDLNPDIRGIAEAYTRENLDVINQPNFHQVVNDGRNALLLSPRQYSLIISDATNPKMFDSWTLYSQEFYELVKDRLKPGGVFCQWALIPLPADAIKVILNTFRSVFPHMSVWVIHGSSQFLMLGTPERLNIDYADLSAKLGPLFEKADLSEFGIDTPEKFLSFFTLGEDGVGRMLEGFGKVSTDDLPYAQFIITQDRNGNDNCLDLVRYQESIRDYMTPGAAVPDSFAATMEALEDIARRLEVGYITGDQSKFAESAVVALDAGLHDANVAHHLNCCPEKIRHFEDYLKRVPDDLTVRNTLGVFHMNSGDYAAATREFRTALSAKPDHAFARMNLARAELEAGAEDMAMQELLAVSNAAPSKGVLASTPYLLNRARVLRKLDAAPDSVELIMALAADYYQDAQLLKSVQLIRRALAVDSTNREILFAYANLCERHEFVFEAAKAYGRLAALSPGDQAAAAKRDEFNWLAADPAARKNWLNSRLFVPETMAESPEEPSGHPPTCDEALALWNETDADGATDSVNLMRAAELYVKSTETNPEEVHAYVDAGTLYEKLGDYSRAARLWQTAARFRPDLPFITLNAARLEALAELAQGKLSGCAKAEKLGAAADAHLSLGEAELALTYAREAAALCVGDTLAWVQAAFASREIGDYDAAIAAAQQALVLDSTQREALNIVQSLSNLTPPKK